MIPSVADCFRYMEQYRMLDNIRDHSIIVARVAALLVRDANRAGSNFSLELAVAGALMHDIGKTACLDTEEDHARMGMEICLTHGLDEIAPIVDQHVVLKECNGAPLSEKEIVYYADKRVNHDQVVSLEDRLAYILDRYANGNRQRQAAILYNFERCQRLEARLFKNLTFAPARVAELIDHRLFADE